MVWKVVNFEEVRNELSDPGVCNWLGLWHLGDEDLNNDNELVDIIEDWTKKEQIQEH